MKAQLMVVIDAELLLELRKRNVNKSSLINSFLKEYLNVKEITDNTALLTQEIIKIKSELIEREKALESIKDKNQKEYNKKHGVIKSTQYIQ